MNLPDGSDMGFGPEPTADPGPSASSGTGAGRLRLRIGQGSGPRPSVDPSGPRTERALAFVRISLQNHEDIRLHQQFSSLIPGAGGSLFRESEGL